MCLKKQFNGEIPVTLDSLGALKMIEGIQVGNRVLAAGIYGTVKNIGEKTIEMEIAPGVVIEVSKNAVANVEGK